MPAHGADFLRGLEIIEHLHDAAATRCSQLISCGARRPGREQHEPGIDALIKITCTGHMGIEVHIGPNLRTGSESTWLFPSLSEQRRCSGSIVLVHP